MNLYLLICSVFLGYVAEGQALKCWECNDEAYDGNPLGHNCYDKVTATNTCTAVQLCLSKFILKDGLPMSVRRGCDYISGYQEQGNIQCDVSINQNILYPNTKALTTCYYSCNTTDNCNNISTTKLKPCTKPCPAGISYCDYLTGNCVCKTPAYKFPNCPAEPSPTTYRSCVQCNGETDDNCHNMTKSSRCSGNETSQPFCSTTKTSTITPNVTVVRNIVTRGCAYSFTSAYECFFSKGSDSSLSTYTEYTCISTCETDGCNTGITPDEKNKRLFCVQCDFEKTAECETMTTRTRCPSDTAEYCVSEVEYYIFENVDRNSKVDPQFILVNVTRRCATEAVTKQCKSTLVKSLGVKKVICQESCQTDGCNIGWPARPQCSICNSRSSLNSSGSPVSNDGYDSCIYNPPSPVQCEFPYQQYCVASLKTKNLPPIPNTGYAQEMVRSCSYYDYGNGCTDVGAVGEYVYSYYNCNRTCETYGCNSGLISGSIQVTSSVYWHFFPAMVTVVSQQWTGIRLFRIRL